MFLDIVKSFIELELWIQTTILYLVIINIITFFYFGLDKIKAHWDSRRIRERTLWILSLIGGSIGALLGMNFFRHKTKKASFQAGMAIILALQIVIVLQLLS